MNLFRSAFIAAIALFSTHVSAQQLDGSGLKFSAAADIVGSYKTRNDSTATDKTEVREAEILLTAPIDHRFEGLISFASHREAGESKAELHEAFIKTSNLVPRSNIRFGQFFLGVGRLNRFHRHEWNFITAPKVQRTFFDEEGALDTGLEYTYIMPLPFYMDVTAGVTNGYTYGHSHDEGEKPRQPTHYVRTSVFHPFFWATGAQTGLNYLGRTSSDNTKMNMVGLDFLAKWKEGSMTHFLLQSEIWARRVKAPKVDHEDNFGLYLFPQVGITEEVYFGMLYDFFTNLSLKNALDKKVNNSQQAISPTLTYKASEFSTLRVAYTFGMDKQDSVPTKYDSKVEFQATFIIGAHPAHEF